jgi:hypothetical protein
VLREQPFLIGGGTWLQVWDGNPTAAALYDRHYSRNPKSRGDPRFAGPGEKIVLLTPRARALFVWRKFISKDGQQGVNCAIFRNEGAGRSSDLIRAACAARTLGIASSSPAGAAAASRRHASC